MTVDADELLIDENAFREGFSSFYGREFHAVVGLAYVLSGSRSAAEDLAQEAFLAALRNWERIRAYDNPGSWVRRVVANRAVSRFRRGAAEARALLRFAGSAAVIPEPDPSVADVAEAIRRLPTRQAQVIALRFFDGSGIADIASILDCSENTVKTHLQRAKQALAHMLEEEGR